MKDDEKKTNTLAYVISLAVIGFEIIAYPLGLAGLGWKIDSIFNTTPLFIVIGLLFGLALSYGKIIDTIERFQEEEKD